MKYNRLWHELNDMLPSNLQKHCINYKNWKKISKNNTDPDVILALNKRCKQIDKVFISECKTISSCFNHTHTIDDLLDFAMLNKKTVYKICKRLDKRTKSHSAMHWLNHSRRYFQFINGFWLNHLESSKYYKSDPRG